MYAVEDKADRIGQINEIDSAIKLLRKCDSLGIVPGSLVKQLPDTDSPEFQFVVAHMNESTNSDAWEEVLFDGHQFWLDSGDLLIKR